MKKLYIFLYLLFNCYTYSQTLVGTIDLPSGAYWTSGYGMVYENSKYWISSSSSTEGKGIFYAVNSNGNLIDTVTVTNYPAIRESQGLAFDGTNFWYVERKTARCDLFKISPTGVILDSIPIATVGTTSWYLGGAAWDNDGLWVSLYSPDASSALYKIDVAAKQIIDTIPVLQLQPTGIAIKGDTLFYVNDGFQGVDKIYAVDLNTEDTLFSFNPPEIPGQRQNPRGLAWDGNHFWLLAEPIGASSGRQLFKYDLSGAGSPGISILTPNINFGNVQIDSTSTSNIVIQNFGTANLVVDSALISNTAFTLQQSFPVIVTPGSNQIIPVSFTPAANVNYIDSIRFYHNDVNFDYSKVNVTGMGVFTAPYIGFSDDPIEYGSKRINSTSYKTLTVTNLGSAVLNIDSVKNSSPNFYFEDLTTPITLDSVASTSFRVWFNPTAISSFQDSIIFYTNAANGNVKSIVLNGNGASSDTTLGTILWEGYIPDNPATTADDLTIRAMRQIQDINGDEVLDIIVSSENYWTIAFNGNSSGTSDILWKFSSYPDNTNAGSVDYIQGLQIASDLNADNVNDVVIGTGGGNEFVYALNGLTGEKLWEHGDSINSGNGDIMGLDVKRDFNNDGVPDVLAAASGNEFNGEGRFSVLLIDGRTGNIIWTINQASEQKLKYMVTSTDFGGAVGSRVGTTNEVIGFNQQGNIAWVFPTTGTPWTVYEIEDIGGSAASDVIVGTTTGMVYALKGDSGTVLWSRNLGNVFIEDLRITSDITSDNIADILVSGINPNIFLLDGETGQIVWQNGTGGNILGINEVGDIDGDGLPDMATSSLNNVVHIWQSRYGHQLFSFAFGTGNGATAAEHTTKMDDIDGNGSFEFTSACRSGRLVTFSGGSAIDVPVEMTTFTANVVGSNVTLNWSTATELNNSGFYVERKSLEGSYIQLTFLEGNGTTTSANSYSYLDKDLLNGNYYYRLKQVDYDGTFEYSKEIEVAVGLPITFSLEQNYPNPFNPSTKIKYSVPATSNVKLVIYNLLGEQINTLVNQNVESGFYTVEWNGTNSSGVNVPSGIYFYRLEAGDYVNVKKMLMLK